MDKIAIRGFQNRIDSVIEVGDSVILYYLILKKTSSILLFLFQRSRSINVASPIHIIEVPVPVLDDEEVDNPPSDLQVNRSIQQLHK